MKKKNLVLIGVVAIIAIAIFTAPLIREQRAYNEVKKQKTLEACEKYLANYPSGRHVDDVEFLKIESSGNTMSSVMNYLNNFPNGKHAKEANDICDRLWDEEIYKYANRDRQREDPKAVAYMSEMLQYMKAHRINSILMEIKSTLNLKDYNEYDKNIRDLLELLVKGNLRIKDKMISLKDNFSSADNSTLIRILSEGAQESFDKMFSPGFITVTDESKAGENLPQLHFDYTISNQEIYDGVPNIWTYTENHVTKNYLMGISIVFKAHFSIPGSSTVFDYTEVGEPEDNISNVDDIRDGYRRMTAMCFAQFSNKMSANMGLKETFFQGEE